MEQFQSVRKLYVYALLSNFHPAFVPSPHVIEESDTEDSMEDATGSECETDSAFNDQ